jgi:hypothetical protein
MRKKINILAIINVPLTLLGIGVLYFSSLFWMGSKEEYDELVNTSYWSFFGNRLLLNLLVGLILIIFIGAINSLVLKITKSEINIRRVMVIDFCIFIICSILFTITRFLNN